MVAIVTREGHVTLPKEIRDHLGIGPGSAIDFELGPGGRVVMIRSPATFEAAGLARIRGRADAGLTTDAILALTRGDP